MSNASSADPEAAAPRIQHCRFASLIESRAWAVSAKTKGINGKDGKSVKKKQEAS